MCTLILGRDVVAPGTLVAGANRDEDPARPTDPPGLLVAEPRVVGGRDRLSGGTWLALREGRALVAMLNRRPSGPPPAAPRSRGLIALETAAVQAAGTDARGEAGDRTLAAAALAAALAALARDAYAPFSLVFATATSAWLLTHEPGRAPRPVVIPPGWHVLTHTELDDRDEPRAARLLGELSRWRPRSLDDALTGLAERLREHGSGADAVCIHTGRMVTVSSSRIALDARGARYHHVEGRPCEATERDWSELANGAPTHEEAG